MNYMKCYEIHDPDDPMGVNKISRVVIRPTEDGL